MKAALVLSLLSTFFPLSHAVTIYNSEAQARLEGTSTASGATATYTGAAAYDPTILTPPSPPSPPIPTQFSIALSATTPSGASIPHSGDFLGFSIEFSVADQVIGRNSTLLQVPFLNLMANIQQRAGHVRIRVGGNTQDYATLVASLPDNEIISKDKSDESDPTETPSTLFVADFVYMLDNVSTLVNIGWWLGIPLNETTDIRLGIAELGQAVLGSKLLGLQVGNEPDLYAAHQHRPANYSPADYGDDFGQVVEAMENDPNTPEHDILIGPNVSGTWTPEMVWNTGFVSTYASSLIALAVEHYPTDNCAALYPNDGFGPALDPQTIFPDFLTHTSGQGIVAAYINSTGFAQENDKPFLMFETNTASCGGFPGISDSFGAALWALDYGLQMAYVNFSGANLHVSGQDVYYNPFTPPPTNQSSFDQWTVGAIYYSVLAIAETLGSSNVSSVLDLAANGNSNVTPAYAIYENNAPTRVALFNYITDPSGANDYTATIQVPSAPSSVQVKYLAASSVSQKENITWAGQTFGVNFGSDGRFQGQESIQTVQCNNGACPIQVPAPGFALVFLTQQALADSLSSPSSEITFATTALTETVNTVTVNPSVLATSNGHSGSTRQQLASTSKESTSGVNRVMMLPSAATVFAIALGAAFVGRLFADKYSD